MLSQSAALALLAAALLGWPTATAARRLARALGDADGAGSPARAVPGRGAPPWARTRWLRVVLAGAAAAGLAQIWSWPVAAVLIAIAGTAGRALIRRYRERANDLAEQAALEGLGVLVTELRSGRPAEDALSTAGRHCRHPGVESLLTRLGRSLRLGDRLQEWSVIDVEAPGTTLPRARGDPSASSVDGTPTRRPGDGRRAPVRSGCWDWQERLIDGVRLSQRTGCALAEVVAAVESDLARRGRQRADLRAAAAGHRATVALLAGLPILGLAMGSGIGAEPVRILTTTPIGHLLLLTGVALELLGLAWSRFLTDRALREG